MKKLYAILLACTIAVSLAACGGGNTGTQTESSPPAAQTASSQTQETSSPVPAQPERSSPAASSGTPSSSSESESSQPENDQASSVASDSSEAAQNSSAEPIEGKTGNALVVYFSWSGNTKSVAQEIQNQTGADSFEIVPATAYTAAYDALLDIAQEEQRNNARPAISGNIDLSGYDTIYLGYPNWWGDMPMILYTFLDDYDLSGKMVAPFCSSGGSGLSGSVGAIRSAEPGATVLDGLHIGSGSASNPTSEVTQWLASHAQ